ncbi:biotin-independent malonate decarboxylase subunit beta [Pedobacter rhodius]|uniref:Biotin-independent malonate decarboxylase subunit beta n=1 Tax=Pedobacter rhodius TaxID=3004098 RepID=A0ABT4L1N3_9SPHI|nr:biotin-independent malonate decarboxylase subunit beta [Pedobacter sp. SJ11]MCZ4225096.1 biotin-independent malonate decarboxylase subunit beta [Pedobacter sp. SJ11]
MMHTSFIELKGRERALALLDKNSFNELLGPFDRMESPHLAPQGIVPESDDGVVIARGTFSGTDAVVLSIEGAFQGGGIGEVCGTKLAASLEHILTDNKNGKKVIPIIIFDTGGVRLQEANYGLLLISEIQSAIVALRDYVPVIGLIPGNVGSFGGMSITAALCSNLIMTDVARFGLNGPEVIEQEAGIKEFNSRDRRLIWDTIGGTARYETGLVDQLVSDDISAFKNAVQFAIDSERPVPRTHQVEKYLSAVNQLDPNVKASREDIVRFMNNPSKEVPEIEDAKTPSRGRTWFAALTDSSASLSDFPGVLVADKEFNGQATRFIAVVPNAKNRYRRAVNGEVGLQEGWVLAKYIQQVIQEDANKEVKRNIVAVIDVPSQAYGYNEELMGIHYACAASADAYATARLRGHKVTGLIVGNAISGAFLAHGLQSSRLIALDDKDINVQAMSKQSAARITKRTIAELEEATKKVPAMAYDIHNYYSLGALDLLIKIGNADSPTVADVALVSKELAKAIKDGDFTLGQRLKTQPAITQGRVSSIKVRTKLAEQWH